MPADFVSLSARMLTPPRRAIASASCVEQQDSSAITGTLTARAISARPSPSQRATGCSTKSRWKGSSARMAWSAVVRSQPWLASTRSETSGPTASRGCLDLEDAVALRHLLARLGDLRVGALHRERPREGHAFAHTPAEQAMHGNAERLAVQVPERHLDRGARERIALHALGHLAAHGFDPCRVASDEPRRDV